MLIRPSAGHAGDDVERLLGSLAAMLAACRLAEADLGMLAALPVDDEHDFIGRLIDVGDDLVDQGAHQTLPGSHGGRRSLPGDGEVLGEAGEIGMLCLGGNIVQFVDAPPAVMNALQRVFPGLFQLGGDQPVVGVDSGVAPLGQ